MRKLTVLLVSKFPPLQGGESVKAFNLARTLTELGHRVIVLAPDPNLDPEYCVEMSEEDWRTVHSVCAHLFLVRMAGGPIFVPRYQTVSERLVSAGIEIVAEEKIDLILGWYLLPYGYVALILSQLCGIPYAIQHAGSDLSRLLRSPLYSRVLTEVIRRARGVLAYPSSVDEIRDITSCDVIIHRPPYLREFQSMTQRSKFTSEVRRHSDFAKPSSRAMRYIVLFLGKLDRGKGLGYLLDAFCLLPPEYELYIYGIGENQTCLSKYLDDQKLTNVTLRRAVPPWQVPQLLRDANAVAVPEHNFSVEGHHSSVPVEAFICGTPVIADNQSKGRYSILDKAFVFVDVEDKEALAAGIQRVCAGNTDVPDERWVEEAINEICSPDADKRYANEIESALSIFLRNL